MLLNISHEIKFSCDNEENTLSVIKFFNRVGGAREFVAIFDDFFKNELEKKSQT